MPFTWINAACLAHKGSVTDYKTEWKAARYMVGGKMFAMVGEDAQGRPIITLKLDPIRGVHLREQYADIIPGYYMNKLHWNSVILHGNVPDALIKDMISESYQILLASLPLKTRRAIAEGT